MIHYKPKQRKFKNEQCQTYSHTNSNGEKVYKPKVKYASDKEAIEAARVFNCDYKNIHKAVAYKCGTCGCWHIGRTDKVLTEKDRAKYKRNDPNSTIYSRGEVKQVHNFKVIIPSAEQELIIKRNLGLL